jgi:hypothetical protein
MTGGDEYRKRAAVVGQKLGRRPNRGTRTMLKNKHCALLEQAANQDWLDGKMSVLTPAKKRALPKSKATS